jgi:CxxC motif-containing protein
MDLIRQTVIRKNVTLGDVVLSNIAGTKADIIITRP